ncbi:MAG: hypothetical protein WA996_10350 [Candidatus Promineifilaceae bacterium]
MKNQVKKSLTKLSLIAIVVIAVTACGTTDAGSELTGEPTAVHPTAVPTIEVESTVAEESDVEQPPEMVWEALDLALSHILERHREQVFPPPGMDWLVENITPEGLVGTTTYRFAVGDLTAIVAFPLVAPDATIYQVLVENTITGFRWEGEIDASGQVTDLAVSSGGTTVVAWYGYVAGTPAGSQFDDYLVVLPEGTAEVGITGADAAIEDEIVAMRDMVEGPGKYAHFWGTLVCPRLDYGGCELAVTRIRADGPGAFFEPDPVEGWEGVIYSGPPGPRSGGDDSFVLLGDLNIWYGIWSADTDINSQLESLRDSGTVIQVWGELIAGIPDWNGTQIQVSRLEVVENPSAALPPAPDWPDADDGMEVYLNEDYGYQLRVPPTATIVESGAVGFLSEEQPEGMTAEEYMTQLQEQYGNQLCVQIENGLGYIAISAPPNKGFRYIPCGLTGLGAEETVEKSEEVTIGGQTYTAQGIEWIGNMAPCSPSRETLDCHSEMMRIELEDGTQVEFGSRYEPTASFEDYLMKGKPMLHQILASYETMPARLSGYSYEGWETYTNEKFGYSVMYPGDAAVMGVNPDEMVQFVGSGHWPILTVEHVDSDFFHPPTGTDVSQWVLDLHTDYDAIGPEMTIAGLPTVHLVYESGPGWEASDEYFFVRDEQLFRILILHSDGQQDWDLYSQFLYSFSFDD